MITAQINGLLAFWKPADIDANCFLKCTSTRVFFLTGAPCGSKAHYRLLNLFSGAPYNLCLPDSIQKSAGMGEFHIDSK